MRAFNEINLHSREVFAKLSPGGIANMILKNPARPLEDEIMIEARPRGKKITSIESFSGCEKALVAAAFILAVGAFRRSPVHVMDVIDGDEKPGRAPRGHDPQGAIRVVAIHRHQ